MNDSSAITRRGLLAAVSFAGIVPALPALGATQTAIGQGFVSWQREKELLDASDTELDANNARYANWCNLEQHLLSLPCETITDLAAKIMINGCMADFENFPPALVREIHRLSGAFLPVSEGVWS